ncbi:hypothetical protein AN958_01797 [Leucoagaricus sp. SymC.cos]|nr:hypothetical protein AN958_01797 [Leucoagaricus sp. SymC.cos]
MPIEDGTYLIHSCDENIRNFYPHPGYEGQAIGTLSGGSRETPTEWRVQRNPTSNTYTITAKGTRGSWTYSKNNHEEHIVIFSSNPSGWSHHWKFIEIDTRTRDPIVAIASAESPTGGNLYVDLDSAGRLSLEWIQGHSAHNRYPQWRLIKQ